jgi:acetyl esterase/lipase
VTSTPQRFSYGDDRLNYADLHRPASGASRGTVILIHGGFWRWNAEYFSGPTPIALALAALDYTVWQIEYRSVGSRGGWPNTFVDIDAAIAHLAVVAEVEEFETGPVISMGHSAGGHLAVWALGIENSSLVGAISLAGVVNLRLAERENLGRGATAAFLGGSSERYPERYDGGSPAEHPVAGKPVRLIHGRDDLVVPLSQSTTYLERATAAGQDAALSAFDGDHFDVIDVDNASWTLTLAAVTELTS